MNFFFIEIWIFGLISERCSVNVQKIMLLIWVHLACGRLISTVLTDKPVDAPHHPRICCIRLRCSIDGGMNQRLTRFINEEIALMELHCAPVRLMMFPTFTRNSYRLAHNSAIEQRNNRKNKKRWEIFIAFWKFDTGEVTACCRKDNGYWYVTGSLLTVHELLRRALSHSEFLVLHCNANSTRILENIHIFSNILTWTTLPIFPWTILQP